jgi:arylsulfatase A
MNTRLGNYMLVWILALGVGFFTLNHTASAAEARPNVILILVDDFGFECVTANGGESYKTPNMDRLAAKGMRFENCHVQPLCTPTRMQLMTSQYNVRNYVDFGYMNPASRTFANLFHDAGYQTCMAGKWQLGEERSLPKRWGFDEYCLWQFTRRAERYRNPGLEINGKEMDYTNGEYGPDIVCNYALDFITRHKDKPFLLYYPMMLTHDPFVPTPDSPDYNDAAVPRRGPKVKQPKYFRDMVAFADKNIGQIVDKLDELKIRENTLILVLGDNGTLATVTSNFRGKTYQGGKGQRTGNGTHVPLIANWPKRIPTGRVNAGLVDSTDFLPTMCEAAGIKLPKGFTTDGRSFWPQLQGNSGSPREWSYCWYAPRKQQVKFEFVQDLDFKLYRDGTFVDLKKDPQEVAPLPSDGLSAAAAGAQKKLAKVLEHFRNARPASVAAEKAPKLSYKDE